ncbi:hypothetical protein [Paraburkholderia phenoliruptrix]|uniref:Uncharacterized protein n=2 Tax=Paraburkholderia phenoliruptrix TaxID=252970 RepID=K0DZH5_9BURK|nr:hypothetical protein [Paraburkholderia phenoliruptrix]AFT89523.1 hypothetical protein BUPH_06701 [Paraburkholderia phenoliruptrix BR3459a]MDR6423862.1 hypothetical protein [Paraburkholderia phenoliruptrix]CAB4050531.1 hypothetical protein LMG9964_04197 [Paraburkholderia phenoliruptrix]
MMEFFSPAVVAAILRVSSTPIFSLRLAAASLLVRREMPRGATETPQRANPTREDAIRV